MARTVAGLPEGTRITDYISLGAVAKWVPLERIKSVLERLGRQSQRQRQLPAHVMVYYVIALALYMEVSYGEVLRCLVESLEWLGLPTDKLRSTGPSGISQARTRLGSEPLKVLYEELARPVAVEATRGAWYRGQRLISLDGSTLDIADEKANEEAFGRPGASRGVSGYPQLRFVSLLECGTHVLFGAQNGSYRTSEVELARRALTHLKPGMLCLADRHFFSFALWTQAAGTGADLLWRMKVNATLPCHERLDDGSYLSMIYPSQKHRRQDAGGVQVRVVEYTLDGVDKAEPLYRLLTTILDPSRAPAQELAALYQERWEIENSLGELKTHLRGQRIVLRSKSPELVHQEFYGLLLAHFAVRAIMHEAALHADLDPDELSFVHAVRVVKRKIITAGSFPPSGESVAP